MSKSLKNTEMETTTAEDVNIQSNRRDFMKFTALGLALSGVSLPGQSIAATGQVGLGPKRKVAWVTHSVAEWNLPLDVGFRDFCEQSGWEYQKFGVAGNAYTIEANVNQINLATQTKPDILIATLTNPALEPALVAAEAAGILVMVNNSNDEATRAAHGWGYVGADGYQQGLLSARLMADDLVKRLARKGGVVVYGNPEPGNAVLEARKQGMIDAFTAFNEKNGTTFEVREFADQAWDLAQSIPLYAAQQRSLGENLAGFLGGYNSLVGAFRSLEEAGVEPGSIPVGGMDTSPDINEGIEKGYIVFAVEQELYNQSYLAVAAAWARLERLFIPPIVNTGMAVVTKDNLKMFKDRSVILLDRATELGLRQ